MTDTPTGSDLVHALARLKTEETGQHDRELRAYLRGAADVLALVEQEPSSASQTLISNRSHRDSL